MSGDSPRVPVVVLDTNLFVAAYWNARCASAWIIEMCLSGEAEALCTADIARELRYVIRTIRARGDYAARVENFIRSARMVEPVAVPERAPDPDDQKFLECAAAGADWLVTSDEHLLGIRGAGRAVIVKPASFLREAQAGG